MKEGFGFLLDIILISTISLAQSLSFIVFNSVKPNLVLAALVIFIFSERSFTKYVVLVLISLIFLNYSFFISKELIIFGVLMILAFYFKKFLSENIFLYSFLLTSILTTLFYLLIDFKFIIDNSNLFLLELFYNISASLIFGSLYKNFYYEKE